MLVSCLHNLSDNLGYTFSIFLGHFGVTLASIWGHFGNTLGSLWAHFGVTLGSLWDHFGVTLGHFRVTLGHFGVPGPDTVPMGHMMAVPKCLFSYCKTNILAISSCLSSWCYTWWYCENVGFIMWNRHFGIVIMYRLKMLYMMTVPNCWFSYRKTNVLAISSSIASWWQTWWQCENVGFTIGK